ncbi:glycosyltransferase family 4 protein [Deltaproteobacteria bacterium TL4]
MKIVFVISSLSAGGAERVMSTMANYWVEKGWAITIITFSNESSFYELHPEVNHHKLGLLKNANSLFQAIKNNVMRLWLLRQSIRKYHPDVVISFMDRTNVLVLIATKGLHIPVIVSERISPILYNPGNVWKFLRKYVFLSANVIVTQTIEAKEYYPQYLKKKIKVIPNPVFCNYKRTNDFSKTHGKIVVALGRLTHQKGFDLLIEAFAKITSDFPDWKLWIIGEGESRQELETLSWRLSLNDKVVFMGRVHDPENYLEQADLFVLASRFEGFPNALCEAMFWGLAVISTDCPSGPRDIIQHGVNGLLVPPENSYELSIAMKRLMLNENEREQFGREASKIRELLKLPNIMKEWEILINSVMN